MKTVGYFELFPVVLVVFNVCIQTQGKEWPGSEPPPPGSGAGFHARSLNGELENSELVVRSDICQFGKAIPAQCVCPSVEMEPICGSDLENYGNTCLFECARRCNPRLDRYDGKCPENGGLPKKPRLNYTKRIKAQLTQEELDAMAAGGDDSEELGIDMPVEKLVSVNRGLGIAADGFSFRKK